MGSSILLLSVRCAVYVKIFQSNVHNPTEPAVRIVQLLEVMDCTSITGYV